MPETLVFYMGSPLHEIRIKITGISARDCVKYLEKRREELNRVEGNVDMYTPKLQRRIAEKGLAKVFN